MSDDDDNGYDEVEIDADLTDRLRDAQQAYDEVREYFEGLKDEIKERYADRRKVLATHDGEEVFTYWKQSSTRIDAKRLKREWPDIHAQYATTKTSAYLSIRRPKAAS